MEFTILTANKGARFRGLNYCIYSSLKQLCSLAKLYYYDAQERN